MSVQVHGVHHWGSTSKKHDSIMIIIIVIVIVIVMNVIVMNVIMKEDLGPRSIRDLIIWISEGSTRADA